MSVPQNSETTRPSSRFLRPQDLRKFRSFQFAAKLVVEGFYVGRHRSPYHDASSEFADYRPYTPGDEIRSLDWRAYARTDRDYVKLFRKDTDMRCHVLLDVSRSMGFRDEFSSNVVERTEVEQSGGTPDRISGNETKSRLRRWLEPWLGQSEDGDTKLKNPTSSDLTKFEYGAYLAAALCYLMIQQGDKASLALGATDLQSFAPPGGTISHLHNMMHALEQARPDGATGLSTALKGLFALARRRGLLVVISDFLEEPDALFDSLSMYTHRGWQVLLLHVLTNTELMLPGSDGPQRYLDSEAQGLSAEADPDAIRVAYKAEVQTWLDTLETQCKARRIHYMRLTTATHYDHALERYLTTRARQ